VTIINQINISNRKGSVALNSVTIGLPKRWLAMNRLMPTGGV